MAAKKSRPDDHQGDLFSEQLFPVRRRSEGLDGLDLSLRIKTALGVALKEHHESAAVVAARMSGMLGRQITEAALYSCTAPAKPEHDIGITRLIAFARVTNASWLWSVVLQDEGLTVLEGEEARFAQIGHLRQEKRRLEEQIGVLEREMKARPVQPRQRRRARA